MELLYTSILDITETIFSYADAWSKTSGPLIKRSVPMYLVDKISLYEKNMVYLRTW